MRRWSSASEEETRRLGAGLVAELLPDGILLLSGDLGAGKTVLVQGVAAGLGIDPAAVQSPTFTLVRELHGPAGRFLHLDLYRLEPREAAVLGLDELLAGPGVKAVEWAERLPFPVSGIALDMRRVGERERVISELVGQEASGARTRRPVNASAEQEER